MNIKHLLMLSKLHSPEFPSENHHEGIGCGCSPFIHRVLGCDCLHSKQSSHEEGHE